MELIFSPFIKPRDQGEETEERCDQAEPGRDEVARSHGGGDADRDNEDGGA